MAAELDINISGAWNKAKEVWVNRSGTWTKLKEIWVNNAGSWVKVFQGILYEGTMTAGNTYNYSTYYDIYGFSGAVDVCGSVSPTTMTDAKNIHRIADYVYSASPSEGARFSLSGLGTDPGSTYFTSITVGSVTLYAADATYGFISNVAYWSWNKTFFGIGTGTYSVVIV